MNNFRKNFVRGVFSLLALSTVACQPSYGSIEFEPLSTPPVAVTVRSFLIEMPEGVAVVVRATPISDGREEYESGDKVDLYSRDRDVMTVHRRDHRREFVLVGVSAGSTCLEVEIDGEPQECIDVEITGASGT